MQVDNTEYGEVTQKLVVVDQCNLDSSFMFPFFVYVSTSFQIVGKNVGVIKRTKFKKSKARDISQARIIKVRYIFSTIFGYKLHLSVHKVNL